MVKRERLYDAFGELIYAIAMADGEVQDIEVETLKKILNSHPWAREIKWSFDYEKRKNNSVEDAYKKAILACKENGPDPEYKYLLEVMVEVAKAFDGIVPSERIIIENFRLELEERFRNDLEKNHLNIDS